MIKLYSILATKIQVLHRVICSLFINFRFVSLLFLRFTGFQQVMGIQQKSDVCIGLINNFFCLFIFNVTMRTMLPALNIICTKLIFEFHRTNRSVCDETKPDLFIRLQRHTSGYIAIISSSFLYSPTKTVSLLLKWKLMYKK